MAGVWHAVDWELGRGIRFCVVAISWLPHYRLLRRVWGSHLATTFQQHSKLCRWPLLNVLGRWPGQRFSDDGIQSPVELQPYEWCRYAWARRYGATAGRSGYVVGALVAAA